MAETKLPPQANDPPPKKLAATTALLDTPSITALLDTAAKGQSIPTPGSPSAEKPAVTTAAKEIPKASTIPAKEATPTNSSPPAATDSPMDAKVTEIDTTNEQPKSATPPKPSTVAAASTPPPSACPPKPAATSPQRATDASPPKTATSAASTTNPPNSGPPQPPTPATATSPPKAAYPTKPALSESTAAPILPSPIVTPGVNDILFGNNISHLAHAGTKQFEKLITQFLDPYQDFQSRNEGFRVLESIRGHITHRGGRFLRQIDNNGGVYVEMSAAEALSEIKNHLLNEFQLRDRVRKLQKAKAKEKYNRMNGKQQSSPPSATDAPAKATKTSTSKAAVHATRGATAAAAAAAAANNTSSPNSDNSPPQHNHSTRKKQQSQQQQKEQQKDQPKYVKHMMFNSVKETKPTSDDIIARGGVEIPFPWKLHEMLEDTHNAGEDWIVSWQPHGRSFLVHKPNLFVEKIMPTYFNQSKFASFQRQLNLYGFQRLSMGKDKGAYYHPMFLRGQIHMCHGVIRQKIKGTKVRRKPQKEPNFYDQLFLPQIPPGNRATKDVIKSSLAHSAPKPSTARYRQEAAMHAMATQNEQALQAASMNTAALHHLRMVQAQQIQAAQAEIMKMNQTLANNYTLACNNASPSTDGNAVASSGTVATRRNSGLTDKSNGDNNDDDSTTPPDNRNKTMAPTVTSGARNTMTSPRTVMMQTSQRSHAPKESNNNSNKESPPQSTTTAATPKEKPERRSSNESTPPQRLSGQKRNSPSQQTVNDLNTQITNLANAGAAKDAEIRRLRAELANNSKEVMTLRQASASKDREIHKLTAELAKKDRHLSRLEGDRTKVLKGLFHKETWESMDTFRDNLYI